MISKYRLDLICIGLLLLVAGLFLHGLFYPHLSLFALPDYAGSDLWNEAYASKYFLAESLHKGQLPLWNPYVGTGYPEYAKGEIGTFFIPNLLLFSLFSFPVAINLMFVSIFCSLLIGMYVLGRKLDFSREASVCMSLAFTFSAFAVSKVTHVAQFECISLVPWILILMRSYMKKPTIIFFATLTCILAQQLYAGYFQIVFMTWIMIGMYVVYQVQKKRDVQPILLMIPVGILFILISAVQLLPSLEFIQLTQRGKGFSATAAVVFSYPWSSLKTFFDPFIKGNPATGNFPYFADNDGDIFWENISFLSRTALVLAVIGACTQWRRKGAFALILVVCGILLMTGKYSPLYFIHTIYPFSLFRTPSKYLLITMMGIVMFVGFGYEEVTKRISHTPFKKVFPYIISILIVVELYSFYTAYIVTLPADTLLKAPEIVSHIPVDSRFRVISYGTGELWNKIMLKDGWKSMDEYVYLKNGLQRNMNVLYGVPGFDVYEILKTRRMDLGTRIPNIFIPEMRKNMDAMRAYNNALDLNAIHVLIAPKIPKELCVPTDIKPPHTYVERNLPPLSYVVRPSASPRIHLVDTTYEAHTLDELGFTLKKEEFDASRSALLDTRLKLDGSVMDADVRVVQDEPQKISVQVTSGGSVLMVVADSFYPGWKAYLDSQPADILPVNVNQRGVVVPKGNHAVDMKYEPDSLRHGAILSVLGYMIIGLLIVLSRASDTLRARFSIRVPRIRF